MWDSVYLCFDPGRPEKQKKPFNWALPQSTGQKHIAFGFTTVLCHLCEKTVLTVPWKKWKESPTAVTVPRDYKETNPDARIWGISSAMWLCSLAEGQKNIQRLKNRKAVSWVFLWPWQFMLPSDTVNWHLTSGIYSAAFKENSGSACKHDLFKFLMLYIIQIASFSWQPEFLPKCQWLNKVILKPISHLLPPNPSMCLCVH